MNLLLVFLLIYAVRLASVYVVQTYYVPDEYWQSLEVAHKMVFGYGHLTWEWRNAIRSYIYPMAFAAIYKFLALLNLDTAQLLIILPRILQATLSAYSDYRFFLWCGKKKWALFLILVPWFWFFICSRTLINTLETSLTTIALSYFPWYGEGTTYLWFAAICCFLRPTAVLIWIPLCVYHIRKTRLSPLGLIFKRFLLIGALVGGVCIAVDSYWYGKFIVTPYEFFKYNIFHNVGSFYGSQPWYWYITLGLPAVLGITTLPFIYAVIDTVRHREQYPVRKVLLIVILITLVVLGAVEHKEFRFVAPLLPLCLYITTETMTRWSYNASQKTLWFISLAILFGNAFPSWYFGTTHQRGPIDVMSHLQKIAHGYRDENGHRANILYLMPCHSTPYYSHVHENVTMRFLTCEPDVQNNRYYEDEADQFYKSPVHWLRSHIPSYPRTAMPTHVILFEPLAPEVNEFLLNYKLLKNISHTQHVEYRKGKNILIYQRLAKGEENTFNRDEFKAVPNQNAIISNEAGEEEENEVSAHKNKEGYASEHNLFN